MTKIPPDDILEGLYKLRIRESGKLKTVLELYNMEIHQKKAGPDDQGDGVPKAGQEQAAAADSRTVWSALQKPPVRRTRRNSRAHVVRGWQPSPILAQQPAVFRLQ